MKELAVSKYLQHYAEPLAKRISTQLVLPGRHNYQQALVIPAFQEPGDFLYRLPQNAKKFLLLVVINQSDATAIDPLNLQLAQSIQDNFKTLWKDSQCQDGLFAGEHYDILLIDCFTAGRTLPPQEGVGLARKVGADTVCHLITMGYIQSPWIFNTDADTYLPKNYFAIDGGDAAAVVFPFQHGAEGGLPASLAMRLYDFSLHYYVAGLQFAGSPYAFHTIGSCIAFDYRHYCRVRGFPKRNAGEDFYLLNKINKTGGVKSLGKPRIRIAERLSHRVPFGTGPALMAISEMSEPLHDYLFYHPLCFHALGSLLQAAEATAQNFQRAKNPIDGFLEHWQQTLDAMSLAKTFDNAAQNALMSTLGLGKALRHAHSHSKNAQQFSQHFHHWFDGFRTLKCIHYLRQHHFNSIAFGELIEQAAFAPLSELLREPLESMETWHD